MEINRKFTFIFFVSVTLTLLFSSCDRDGFDISEIDHCFYSSDKFHLRYDSAGAVELIKFYRESLLGDWLLYNEIEGQRVSKYMANENITLSFDDDGTLSLLRGDEVLFFSQWDIQLMRFDGTEISTASRNPFVSGGFKICGNELLITNPSNSRIQYYYIRR